MQRYARLSQPGKAATFLKPLLANQCRWPAEGEDPKSPSYGLWITASAKCNLLK